MKSIIKRIIKIIIAGIVFALSYYAGTAFPSLYYYTIMFICPFSVLYAVGQVLLILYDIACFRRIVKRLEPYIRPVLSRLGKFVSNAANFLLRLAHHSFIYQKFEYRRLRDTSRITGYHDEYRHSGQSLANQEYETYALRWRKCKNDAQRVRYTYLKYVQTNRKAGKPFSYADTPSRLQKRWHTEGDTRDELLVKWYYPARYGNSECLDMTRQEMDALHKEWH